MFHVLKTEPGQSSNPSMVAADDDLLITYPLRRETIRFVQLPSAAIPGTRQ